ncbi:MAG: DUF3791 domain-containing protein [Prevotellaceae bacterium]|nr:DUF3791 domain-containing protein [Prevotellaceae bacterium]
MSEQNLSKIGFLVALINEFGKRFGLTDKQSYDYISRYGGIEMFLQHYNILHTLSFHDMVEGMASYCNRQGGELTL